MMTHSTRLTVILYLSSLITAITRTAVAEEATVQSSSIAATTCSVRNSLAAKQWHQFIAESEPKMKSLRLWRNIWTERINERPIKRTMQIWAQIQLVLLERQRVELWYKGALDSPLLAINSKSIAVYLPYLTRRERQQLQHAIDEMRKATNSYILLLNRQTSRLRHQYKRLASTKNRLIRTLLRGWYAMRNLGMRIRNALVRLNATKRFVFAVLYTQFLRFCDYQTDQHYAALGLNRAGPALAPVDLEQVKGAYRRLHSKYHPKKNTYLPETVVGERKTRFKRIESAKEFLISSGKERLKTLHNQWIISEADRMIHIDCEKMEWVPKIDINGSIAAY